MAHSHDTPSKWEISSHAALPVLVMLFIQMVANHFGSPAHSIFLSPYLIAFFTTALLALVVLWKGQICPGQKGRLSFVLPFLAVFAFGNFLYTAMFTPKHILLSLANLAALVIPLLYWKFPDDNAMQKMVSYLGFAIGGIGILAYSISYWFELPSLLNWGRGNYFAQIQLGLLLLGWYMMLAKSRLDGFFKLLVQLTLIILILNYAWSVFVLYQTMQMAGTNVLLYLLFFVVQFVILALLAWLLLGKKGKNIKNPTAWTAATFLSMLYPLVNVF